jgi:hypothetical protein
MNAAEKGAVISSIFRTVSTCTTLQAPLMVRALAIWHAVVLQSEMGTLQ